MKTKEANVSSHADVPNDPKKLIEWGVKYKQAKKETQKIKDRIFNNKPKSEEKKAVTEKDINKAVEGMEARIRGDITSVLTEQLNKGLAGMEKRLSEQFKNMISGALAGVKPKRGRPLKEEKKEREEK